MIKSKVIPRIEMKSLKTGYHTSHGPVVIQNDVNASLMPGEFSCLLGSNGAGKTTLLRTLTGFIPPLDGEIFLDGINIIKIKPHLLSRKIGVVLTERPSMPSTTVSQLIALGRSPYTGFWGRMQDNDREIVEKALLLTDTYKIRDRLIDTLSDGERQKVMIAKALAQETDLIFLDEPTAFLDFPSKAEMMRMLKSLAHESGKTIFLSTHDINMALALADNIWLIDREYGVVTGTPRNLADDGSLERFFLRPGLSFDQSGPAFNVTD